MKTEIERRTLFEKADEVIDIIAPWLIGLGVGYFAGHLILAVLRRV